MEANHCCYSATRSILYLPPGFISLLLIDRSMEASVRLVSSECTTNRTTSLSDAIIITIAYSMSVVVTQTDPAPRPGPCLHGRLQGSRTARLVYIQYIHITAPTDRSLRQPQTTLPGCRSATIDGDDRRRRTGRLVGGGGSIGPSSSSAHPSVSDR